MINEVTSLAARVHARCGESLGTWAYWPDAAERLRAYHAQVTTDDYREMVREHNEIARRRFVDVPEHIAEDWKEEDRKRRAGKLDREPCLLRCSSVGCYSLIYLTAKNEVLCARCAFEEIARGEAAGISADVYWEGPPMSCEECGEGIESAYGDPDAGEEDNE